MIGVALLVVLVLLPPAVALASMRLPSPSVLPVSTGSAIALVLLSSLAVVDVELPLVAGRALRMSPIAQLGVQLMALAMLGFVMGIHGRPSGVVRHWVPVAWLSLGGLILALLLNTLPLSLLAFVAAGMLWALGPPAAERGAVASAALRYTALLALVVPLLLVAYRLADERTVSTPELERIVLAMAVPGFGLVLGLIPLHGWTISVASGAPRELLLGVVALVQTAGYALLLRTFEVHPWLTANADGPLLIGGALSALLGGWLAVSARREDPDDWLVYALVANSGILMVGLGTQSQAAAVGVVMMLFARVLALVALSIAPRVAGRAHDVAVAVATLTLAGTPGLAGFPGLWLILRRLHDTGGVVARRLPFGDAVPLAVAAGSVLLFATAIRRWSLPRREEGVTVDRGAKQAAWVLVALMVVVGVAPHLFAPAFERALSRIFFVAQ